MSIEMPGIKIVGKVDLSRFGKNTDRFDKAPRPEKYVPALKNRLESLAGRLNSEYGELVDRNGQIKMSGVDATSDSDLIAAKEKAWAEESGKSLEAMAAAKEKNPANVAEIATTLLFDKVLSDDFIIVRASAHDDYENGADQLIVDKRTGAVICGLDDVIGHNGDDGGEKKKKKIDDKMKSGGAKIKYGVAMNDGRLERKSLRHIPIFYFSLSKSELNSLLEALASGSPDLAAAEKATYEKLVSSLLEQAGEYGADVSLHPELKDNLRSLAPSLEKMQAHIRPN